MDGPPISDKDSGLSVPIKDVPQIDLQEIDFSKIKTYDPQLIEQERLRLKQELLQQNNNYSLNIQHFQQQLETLPESSENRLVEYLELILGNADKTHVAQMSAAKVALNSIAIEVTGLETVLSFSETLLTAYTAIHPFNNVSLQIRWDSTRKLLTPLGALLAIVGPKTIESWGGARKWSQLRLSLGSV